MKVYEILILILVECFSLAEIVDELYNRCYRFLPKMK